MAMVKKVCRFDVSITMCWFTTLKFGNWTKKRLWNWKYFGGKIFLFQRLEQWRLTLRKVRPQKILKWSFSGKGPCKKFKLGPITWKFTQNFFFGIPGIMKNLRVSFFPSYQIFWKLMGSICKRTLKSKISSTLLYQKTLPNQSGKGYRREKFPLPSRQFTKMTLSLSNSNSHHFLQWSVLLSKNFFPNNSVEL